MKYAELSPPHPNLFKPSVLLPFPVPLRFPVHPDQVVPRNDTLQFISPVRGDAQVADAESREKSVNPTQARVPVHAPRRFIHRVR